MSGWIEHYTFVMAFVHPAVNAVVLVACIYAIRNTSFRKEFVCLAVAAGLALACSAIMLVVRLAQSGHLAVSGAVRRSLLFPHDVCEIASIGFYCVGFIMLAYHVGSSARATRQT